MLYLKILAHLAAPYLLTHVLFTAVVLRIRVHVFVEKQFPCRYAECSLNKSSRKTQKYTDTKCAH